MGALEHTPGPILIAVVLNTYLFGIGVYQYGVYFSTENNDKPWTRWTIAGLLANDTFHSCLVVYIAWDALITSLSHPANIVQAAHWSLSISIISVTLTAVAVQAFLSYRVLILAKAKSLAVMCFFLTLSAFAFGLTVAIKAWDVAQGKKEPIHDILVTTWLSLEVVVDVLISGILLYALLKEASGAMQSNRVLKRLGKIAVQTGLCSSIFALACMLLWLLAPQTSWYLVFGLAIGRMYTCSLLDTLLSRPVLRAMMSQSSRDQNSLLANATMQSGRGSVRVPHRASNVVPLQDIEGKRSMSSHTDYSRDWK